MEHSIIYNKKRGKYESYEDNIQSGFIDVEIRNDNTMKIADIKAGGTDPNYRTGTELVLHALNQCNTRINVIHGALMLEDAPERKTSDFIKVDKIVGWKKSIPFYERLPEIIYSRTGIEYSFHLYIGRQEIDITDEYLNCANRDIYIEQLINRVTNSSYKFCSFIIKLVTDDD